MHNARAFTCSGLGFSFSARSACSSRLSSSATRPVLGCMSWSWMTLVALMRNLLAWYQSLGMSASSSHGTAPRSLSDCSPATCSAFHSSLPRLKMFAPPGLARGLQRHVDDLLGGLKLLGAVALPPLVAVPHIGPRVHEFSTDRCRVVGPVGFELAARGPLEVAPVRLPGRFRPRLALAQLPDLGGEQLAQAVEYPAEFGADGGQQAVAAPDLTVGLAPLADAPARSMALAA